jgi:TrmH family RNA methyltransferase
MPRPRLGELRRLVRSAAARREAGVMVVEGATLCAEAAAAGLRIREVYLETPRSGDEVRGLAAQLAEGGSVVTELEPGRLAQLGASSTPQPLLIVAERPDAAIPPEGASFVLVAVSVADPGNAGTLLRCAEAAGAGGVIFTGDAVDPYGPKAVRASAGSIFRLPATLSANPVATLADLRERGLRTIGAAAGRGLPYDRADLTPPLALVVGNESHGLPASLAGHMDAWVHVPLGGQAESLNVGAAAAVLCFEVERRRRHAPTADR